MTANVQGVPHSDPLPPGCVRLRDHERADRVRRFLVQDQRERRHALVLENAVQHNGLPLVRRLEPFAVAQVGQDAEGPITRSEQTNPGQRVIL